MKKCSPKGQACKKTGDKYLFLYKCTFLPSVHSTFQSHHVHSPVAGRLLALCSTLHRHLLPQAGKVTSNSPLAPNNDDGGDDEDV